MTLVDLLRRLDAEATDGPWRWTDEYESSNGGKAWSLLGEAHGYGVLSCDEANAPQGIGGSADVANAALIATLRTLLPAIIRELEAGRAWDDHPGDITELVAEDDYREARRHSDEEARRHE